MLTGRGRQPSSGNCVDFKSQANFDPVAWLAGFRAWSCAHNDLARIGVSSPDCDAVDGCSGCHMVKRRPELGSWAAGKKNADEGAPWG